MNCMVLPVLGFPDAGVSSKPVDSSCVPPTFCHVQLRGHLKFFSLQLGFSSRCLLHSLQVLVGEGGVGASGTIVAY